MKTLKVVVILLISFVILIGTGLFLTGKYSPKPGGIRIETTPKATVFINGSLVGETPFSGSYKTGEILLKLVPDSSSGNLVPFETTVKLTAGIETAVGRTFASTEASSSGYIISFDKTGSNLAGLVAISQPENAQVVIDGVSRGFSSYNVTAISPAMHTITIRSPGYLDFTQTVKTLVGYRLTFYAKLAKGENPEVKKQDTAEDQIVKMVKILDTPTGYLRVRTEPGLGGSEIAQVVPGESFPYIDTDVASGWIEIQYEASKSGLPSGITGWISGDYATVSSELKP